MIDRYPGATFLPSPNRWVGRAGHPVLAIVDHIAQGTLAGCDAEFADPSSELSAHFCVDTDGTVHQYVSLNDSAWANGIVEPGNTMPGAWPAGDPNWWTVSIEHAGRTGDPFPEAQYRADRDLHRWLLATTGLAATRDTIVGHYRISPRTRPACPGDGFAWSRLMSDLTPVVNWPQRKIFVDWVRGRYDNGQPWWGPEGLAAFVAFLPRIGCDPATPATYGWPC